MKVIWVKNVGKMSGKKRLMAMMLWINNILYNIINNIHGGNLSWLYLHVIKLLSNDCNDFINVTYVLPTWVTITQLDRKFL